MTLGRCERTTIEVCRKRRRRKEFVHAARTQLSCSVRLAVAALTFQQHLSFEVDDSALLGGLQGSNYRLVVL